MTKKPKVFSGIQPSGTVHIGNYLGAIKNWAAMLDDYDCVFGIVDYHAMTISYDPAHMQEQIFDAACVNIACGLDPSRCILFVHAHVGHYAGLIHLGREVMGARGMPVYATPLLAGLLRDNVPWSQLVALGNIKLCSLTPGSETQLAPHLHLTPLLVPHRDEYAHTVAFVVRGPERRLFYCPDVDAWDEWAHDLQHFVADVDVALLDGTFFNAAELPGRAMSEVPHPLVTDTAARLAGVTCDVRMIHLNHTNPLLAPGPERDWLAARGIGVGACGDLWRL